MGEACQRAHRPAGSVTLIAIAKGQPVEKIRGTIRSGLLDIGENYAQEMLSHVGAIHELPLQPIRWHFVGHLQRKKVKQVTPQVSLIHSVDSLELAREIDLRAARCQKIQPILIEVNLGGESSKSGLDPTKVAELIPPISSLQNLLLKGFMTIPPFLPDVEKTRPFFRSLREIRDEMNQRKLYSSPLFELSMGMTHDFEIAIEEGATMVRIGTGLFGPRSE